MSEEDQPWKPFEGAQEEFCSRGEFEVLYGGQAGPGKTDCLVALASRNVSHPRYAGLLLRRTFPQLQEIIDRCHELYPKLEGVYKSTEHRWYFPSGGKITLGHMQHEADRFNYQGKEYQFVGFDELTQFTELQYLYLFSRCRSSEPGLDSEVRATTNPGGIGHKWVKERFIDNARPLETYIDPKSTLSRAFVPGKIEDNPKLLENDPGYSARLDALPEIERMRLKEGIWDAFEGQVFSELSAKVHAVEPFDIPPEWYRFMVFDWGFTRPFACLWFAMDYDGVIYLYREWYGCKVNSDGNAEANKGLKMGMSDIIAGIKEREFERVNARVADPAIWSRTPDQNKFGIKGPSIIEDFQSAGLFFMKADNDRVQGKMQVHRRLETVEELDESTGEILNEHPQFKAFSNCDHFWRTMPEMREDKKRPEDVDSDGEDHIYDCVRYGFMFRPVKPKHTHREPDGTFQAERKRLIRARKMAQSRGMSLSAAYRKIK